MRILNETSLIVLLYIACCSPIVQGSISAWHENPDTSDVKADDDHLTRKSLGPSAAPSILKRVPNKQQPLSSKQNASRFSAPTVRKPASKKRSDEDTEEIRRRNLWHTHANGVECMYVGDYYHAPIAGYGKGKGESYYSGKGKGKGKGKGGSSEYYYYDDGKGKGKGGSSKYTYESGKGGSKNSGSSKGGGSGSKKSGSKRRNLSSASLKSYKDGGSSYKGDWRPNDEEDDWRKDLEAIPKAQSKRKLRRYVPGHYYDPSDYGYFTPIGKGGKGTGAGYICRYVDRYYDEFSWRESWSYSYIESFTFSIVESFTFSIVESFTFSIVESFTFSFIESFTFSVIDSFSFIFVDDALISEAPSSAPTTFFNTEVRAQAIPFIGDHPDDVDMGERAVEVGEINMKHIGSGKPPTPVPTTSTVPTQVHSSGPTDSPTREPTPKPSKAKPTPSPTKKVADDGTVFLGIRFEGRE